MPSSFHKFLSNFITAVEDLTFVYFVLPNTFASLFRRAVNLLVSAVTIANRIQHQGVRRKIEKSYQQLSKILKHCVAQIAKSNYKLTGTLKKILRIFGTGQKRDFFSG